MNSLPAIIFCAAAAALVGGILVCCRLRNCLPRRWLPAAVAVPVLLAIVAATAPFAMVALKNKPLHDWQLLKERRATADELLLLRESFPTMTGQADREFHHHHYGRFMLAITEFEDEAGARAFWEFRKHQTRHLHLYNGNTHMELYGYFSGLSALIWAEFRPDPLIRRCAALVTHGVMLRWLVPHGPDARPQNVTLFYKVLTQYGYLELILAETPPENPAGWLQIPNEPGAWMHYIPYPDGPDMLEFILELMDKPVPEQFCPPEIFRL